MLRDAQGGAAFGGTVAVENLTVSGNLVRIGGAFDVGGPIEASECKADRFVLRSDVTEARVLDMAPTFAAGEWTLDADLRAVNVTPGRPITWPLRAPHGAQLLGMMAVFSAAAGHAALPSVRARLSFRKMPFFASAAEEVGVLADPASTVAEYQGLHLLELDLTNGGKSAGVKVDASLDRHMVRIDAESGANALPGATVYGVSVIWKRPAGSKVGQD